MSKRYNNGSHYENHQRADELQDGAAHSHRVGEQHGKQDHLTGHEHSRQQIEHSPSLMNIVSLRRDMASWHSDTMR